MKNPFSIALAVVLLGLTVHAKELRDCQMKSNKSLWAQTNPKSYSPTQNHKGTSNSSKSLTRTAKGVQ